MIGTETEGVVTAVPGSSPPIRAKRYSSQSAVPLLMRPLARQIGAGGWWYVALPDTPREAWDKLVGSVATTIQNAHEAIGADNGVLGITGKLLGVPHWMAVALAVVVGYGVLRQLDVVPPVKEIFQ